MKLCVIATSQRDTEVIFGSHDLFEFDRTLKLETYQAYISLMDGGEIDLFVHVEAG